MLADASVKHPGQQPLELQSQFHLLLLFGIISSGTPLSVTRAFSECTLRSGSHSGLKYLPGMVTLRFAYAAGTGNEETTMAATHTNILKKKCLPGMDEQIIGVFLGGAMTESIQISLYDEAHYAVSLANGRQYELGAGDTIELFQAGKWQRAQIAKNLWAEYCAVMAGGETVRLTVGLRARLPLGHPGANWNGGTGNDTDAAVDYNS